MSTTTATRPAIWKFVVAYGIIYLIWGSTYLAIRIGVREMPPFLMAGLRFTIAGLGLYAWMRLTGTTAPSWSEWRSATLLGSLMFLVDYACLFWAEQRVPSGVSAVILATIPVAIALLETVVLRTTRFTLLLALELATGIIGVAVLANPSSSLGEAPLDRRGVMALLLACLGWSVGTIITPRLVLPASKAMSAAAQMLSGGVELLALAALSGELGHFRAHQISAGAWFSLLYLIVAGSIIAFTAYVWLLHYEPPSKVGTYAYVNPAVAVIVGAEFGGETLGRRTVVGTALILLSVVVITGTKSTARRDLIHNETHTAAD